MKVKTLIEKLSKFNPEAEVRLNDYNGDTALFVNARSNDDTVVWLDGEHDIDMGEEISARYEHAKNTQMKELDFYTDLLEIGISANMVRKYMGDDCANTMEEFCENHGLISNWR